MTAELFAAVRDELRRDAVIQQITDEMVAFGMTRDQVAHPSGALRGRFVMRAWCEYQRRCHRQGVTPIDTHFNGPAEAILSLIDEARP